ncbi:MAG: 4-amino-4-deoxychorismate lyase [Alkalinema sp. RU_4_3]|nr:4-amino-4-deoxychorismate lyase [Alkalinema sp. RU_4_3]
MFWYDGQLQPEGSSLSLSPTDPALLYGATLFTTLRVYESLDHHQTQWSDHIDRLKSSLQALGWVEPDWDRVRQGAQSIDSAVRRITLFSDGREMVTGRELPPDLADRQQQGIIAWVAPSERRSLPQHKTGNYLLPWQCLQRAATHGAQEAILLDAQNHWLETATGNLWGYAQGQWWTPPLQDGILPGIARQQIIRRLNSQGTAVQELPWDGKTIAQFEAIAYSNCVVEFVPIRQVIWGDRSHFYPLSTSIGRPNFS